MENNGAIPEMLKSDILELYESDPAAAIERDLEAFEILRRNGIDPISFYQQFPLLYHVFEGEPSAGQRQLISMIKRVGPQNVVLVPHRRPGGPRTQPQSPPVYGPPPPPPPMPTNVDHAQPTRLRLAIPRCPCYSPSELSQLAKEASELLARFGIDPHSLPENLFQIFIHNSPEEMMRFIAILRDHGVAGINPAFLDSLATPPGEEEEAFPQVSTAPPETSEDVDMDSTVAAAAAAAQPQEAGNGAETANRGGNLREETSASSRRLSPAQPTRRFTLSNLDVTFRPFARDDLAGFLDPEAPDDDVLEESRPSDMEILQHLREVVALRDNGVPTHIAWEMVFSPSDSSW